MHFNDCTYTNTIIKVCDLILKHERCKNTIQFFSFNLVPKVLDKNDDNNAYMSHVGFQKKKNIARLVGGVILFVWIHENDNS